MSLSGVWFLLDMKALGGCGNILTSKDKGYFRFAAAL